MAKYSYHQVDANAKDLYAFAAAHGFAVQRLGTPVDALVALYGLNALVEVKTVKGKLRASQERFLRHWPGVSFVWRTEADVLASRESLRRIASREVRADLNRS